MTLRQLSIGWPLFFHDDVGRGPIAAEASVTDRDRSLDLH